MKKVLNVFIIFIAFISCPLYAGLFTQNPTPHEALIGTIDQDRYISAKDFFSIAIPQLDAAQISETRENHFYNVGFLGAPYTLTGNEYAIDIIQLSSKKPKDTVYKSVTQVMQTIFNNLANGKMSIEECHFTSFHNRKAYQCTAKGKIAGLQVTSVATSMLINFHDWGVVNIFGTQVINKDNSQFDFKPYNEFINSLEIKKAGIYSYHNE